MTGGTLGGSHGFTLGSEHGATLGTRIPSVPFWAKVFLEVYSMTPDVLLNPHERMIHSVSRILVQEVGSFLDALFISMNL